MPDFNWTSATKGQVTNTAAGIFIIIIMNHFIFNV